MQEIPIWSILWGSLLFSLFGCLVNLFLAVLVFVGVYLVLVPVVGAVKEEDINNLRSIFGKIRVLAPFVDVLLRFERKVLKLCCCS